MFNPIQFHVLNFYLKLISFIQLRLGSLPPFRPALAARVGPAAVRQPRRGAIGGARGGGGGGGGPPHRRWGRRRSRGSGVVV